MYREWSLTPPLSTTAEDVLSGQLQEPNALPSVKQPLVYFELEAGWAPESVWKLKISDKYWPSREMKCDRSVCGPSLCNFKVRYN